MRVSLSERALGDLEQATEWYLGQQALAAADDLVAEFEDALGLLQKFPGLGVEGRQHTHVFTLAKFPFSLVYRVLPDCIRIIAVAHHSRRPGYWAGRR